MSSTLHRSLQGKYPESLDGVFIEFIKDIFFREKFEHYNPKNYQLSNNDMTVTRNGKYGSYSICYGAEIIPSMNKGIYTWKFKIVKASDWMAIGIDKARHTRKDTGGV